MTPHSVTVKVKVTNWKSVHTRTPDAEWTHWEPTLECGHPHYGSYHPHGGLPVTLECYPCGDIARKALTGG